MIHSNMLNVALIADKADVAFSALTAISDSGCMLIESRNSRSRIGGPLYDSDQLHLKQRAWHQPRRCYFSTTASLAFPLRSTARTAINSHGEYSQMAGNSTVLRLDGIIFSFQRRPYLA